MRYMGDFTQLFAFPGQPLPPQVKAELLLKMPTLTDAQAEDLTDLADATSYGARTTRWRYGIGAAVGIGLGLLVAKLARKAEHRLRLHRMSGRSG